MDVAKSDDCHMLPITCLTWPRLTGTEKKTKLGGMNLCALKSNFPVHLHKSFVDYQVFGSEVKWAILTELSTPVLTPWAVGWVQIKWLG